jgi:hypothetical protein
VTTLTVITDEARTVEGAVDGDRILLDPADLHRAIGWEFKAEGLCQGDRCVPVRDRAALLVGDRVDLAAVAAALGRPSVIDPAAGLAAVALPSEERHRALDALRAPSFTLPDLDGVARRLEEWRGRKKLLLAFSTW